VYPRHIGPQRQSMAGFAVGAGHQGRLDEGSACDAMRQSNVNVETDGRSGEARTPSGNESGRCLRFGRRRGDSRPDSPRGSGATT
jgi:hypothetical protein